MANIVKYKTHYEIFIEGEENPISISGESGDLLKKDLLKQNSGFIEINGSLYNRFKINKVIPYKVEFDDYTEQAIQQAKQRQQELKNLKQNI